MAHSLVQVPGGDVAVGDEPRYDLHSVPEWMEYQVRCVPPKADTDHGIGLKPSVVPFFFLCRLKVYRVHINTHLFQTFVQ